jgi:hypothetical protein
MQAPPYVYYKIHFIGRMKFMVGKTSSIVYSKVQPMVKDVARTMQEGKETAHNIYNKEKGYERANVALYLIITLLMLQLCIIKQYYACLF